MADSKGQRYILFKLMLLLGGLLGMLLLVQSILSYIFITDRMVQEALYRETARQASEMMEMAREAGAGQDRELGPWLAKVVTERESDIAWLRVYSFRGEVLAEAGQPAGESFGADDLRRLFDTGDPVTKVLETPERKVFAALRPFRFGFGSPRPDGPPPSGQRAEPPQAPPAPGVGQRQASSPGRRGSGPRVIEIGLRWDSVGPVFGSIRRAMTISISAALALLAAMAFIGLRFRNYVRGKQLEQQMEVARSVQQDLLPKDSPTQGNLEVSAICDPAWQVGGDFYDVFPIADDRIAVLLGDVSGKGLPAALLMGMLYGAVRSSNTSSAEVDLRHATARLNELICARTSVERFVTMFWCQYDPREQVLHYVNAGHLPPYVAHRNADGGTTITRLDRGGPVLGVVPYADYEQDTVPFRSGDVLVLYSDGVVEAANRREDEFGEERLAEIISRTAEGSAMSVRNEILNEVRGFVGGEPQQDDLTLLVVRAGARVEPSKEIREEALQTA